MGGGSVRNRAARRNALDSCRSHTEGNGATLTPTSPAARERGTRSCAAGCVLASRDRSGIGPGLAVKWSWLRIGSPAPPEHPRARIPMSFKIVEQAPARLNRSELAVPGSQPKLFEKAAASAADVVFLDLEDAVAPDDKPQARKNVIVAINDIDWGSKTLSVRINGLDTHYMYRD